MLFQASHFADVSASWGVSFTVWSEGAQTSESTALELKDLSGFAVATTGTKGFYAVGSRAANEWWRPTSVNYIHYPAHLSGVKIVDRDNKAFVEGALGVMACGSNNVIMSMNGTYLLSGASPKTSCDAPYSLLPSNFLKAVALFSARKLVVGDWMNSFDEYLAPLPEVEASDEYRKWNSSCLAYVLMHPSNNMTAMRDVSYKDKLWRIQNHYFPLTRDQARRLYDRPGCSSLYRDTRGDERDPYLSEILGEHLSRMSPLAREVFKAYLALVLKSAPSREVFAQEHPELHLGSWDAGCYQLKHLWRELYPEEFKALKELHRQLADELRPGVYDLGWLKR